MENNFYIKLENQWFQKDKETNCTLLDELGAESLLVYSILKRDVTIRNTIKFNLNDIYKSLRIDKNKNSNMVKKIKQSIIKMNNKLYTIHSDSNCNEYIDIHKINNNDTYYLKLNKLIEKNFFIVYDWELDQIINIAHNDSLSKAEIVSLFCY